MLIINGSFVRTEIKTPLFPESIKFSNVAEIYVNEGQKVESGQTLFEIETDKVILEIEAPHGGIIENLKINVGMHVNPVQMTMYIREPRNDEVTTESKHVKYIEVIKEKLVKDDSGRVLLEQVVGESLFDKRGLICGAIGLIFGVLIGVIGTYVLTG